MNRLAIYISGLLAAGVMLTSCGGSRKSEEVPQQVAETISGHDTSLSSAISAGDMSHASKVADSLALMVDDLSPAQNVNVLATFAGVVDSEVSGHHSRKALETMRKYVDVYDIALSINPKDMRRAIDGDHRYAYDSLATAYRRRLNDYAYSSGTETGSPAAADSVKEQASDVDDQSELPVNLRPAR